METQQVGRIYQCDNDKNLQEIITLTENYMQNIAGLYEKNPKQYIEKVGISHSKLITKLREQKKQWANTTKI